jgi:starch synthase
LADVSAALPAALREYGIDTRVLLPAYPQALERAPHPREISRLGNVAGWGEARILETSLPGNHVTVWLVDCPALYQRDGGPYQTHDGRDWPDNAERFALLNHAAMAIVDGAVDGWIPHLVHANDWHAGLTPLLLSARKRIRPATVFTIHNLAYQGLFDAETFARLGLPRELFGNIEFYGRISYLKAGIASADALTTVSPTYAAEILTPEYGCGLDGLLRARSDHLTGILNGADYGVWDPRSDPHLPATYSCRSLSGKLACKREIQREMELTPDDDAPLMAFMSRLVHQKMPDVVLEAMPTLIEQGMQFALVAEGDSGYEAGFRALTERFPGRVAMRSDYEEALGHRLLAGSDLLAHPARFEPCGLVPIYALRYGTIPIVRNSGGMADSVVDATVESIQHGTGTGFIFAGSSAQDFLDCTRRALSFYRQPLPWRKLQTNAMAQDFSWRPSAEAYAQLYYSLVGMPAAAYEPLPEPVKIFA